MNDRIALNLGRALLRAIIAEERAAQAEARVAELEKAKAAPEPEPTRPEAT